MDKKPCLLATYVSGRKYQVFIPMLVYSCKKAYPEYDIMLFLHEELGQDVKDVLVKIGLIDKVTIKENSFRNELPTITPLQAKSCRWVMWDDSFRNYEYLYIVDIDMFYIREPMPLHLQHAKRMKMTGLPFDNMRRKAYLHKSIKGLINRIRVSGLHNFKGYLFGKNICEEKLSGLHFVKVNDYYSESNSHVFEKVKNRLCRDYYFPEILTGNNEVLLANMTKEMGYDISCLGIQSDPVTSLSFENVLRSEFRPHHGFHLGIFRENDISRTANDPVLESPTYKYYLDRYLEIVAGEDFQVFYNNLPSLARTYMDRLHFYYNIQIGK